LLVENSTTTQVVQTLPQGFQSLKKEVSAQIAVTHQPNSLALLSNQMLSSFQAMPSLT
jgi:hypothetical protein